ncbi:hypothetical protein NDU88_005030 [Pleurodeles waltl]|uniref:Uncharacterized protein n=1 Tax=Pleurodeles waltl TaxID=8319 RepID=A0AAV7LBE1_PLEWA|nr:hypothetical protein NDU88_005030 [Pleurodeles waltl]
MLRLRHPDYASLTPSRLCFAYAIQTLLRLRHPDSASLTPSRLCFAEDIHAVYEATQEKRFICGLRQPQGPPSVSDPHFPTPEKWRAARLQTLIEHEGSTHQVVPQGTSGHLLWCFSQLQPKAEAAEKRAHGQQLWEAFPGHLPGGHCFQSEETELAPISGVGAVRKAVSRSPCSAMLA